MSQAPDEIYLPISKHGTVCPHGGEREEKYHHDRKYRKAVEALKETIELIENWTDPEDILETINEKLKELGEIE